jgi:prepilin-type processing-associated H-X9-DG protein
VSNECWVAGWLDFTTKPDNTNIDYLIDHTRYPYGAYFGPYLKSATVFKCPADRSVVVIGGQQLPRARSVSMSNYGDPISSRPFTSRFTELGMFTLPTAAFLMLDERPDSIDDGAFITDPSTKWQLIDFPGFLHNGAGNFVFADGHTESHRWEDPRTIPELIPGQPLLTRNVNVPNDLDILWLARHATGVLSYPN